MTANVCIISGLDPSGGAGFIADTRVVERHGLRPVGVVTCLTEQTTVGVRAVSPVDPEIVADQLRALLSDVAVSAVKIGMLGNEAIASAVAEALALTAAPVVWDPVMRPTSGRVALYKGDPHEAFMRLVPHLSVITPNVNEAAFLVGHDIETAAHMESAARLLVDRGAPAALVKGGHLEGEHSIDVLATSDAIDAISGPRIATDGPVHGTGCALSSALASELAGGAELLSAVRSAKAWVAERLRSPESPGRGARSLV